MEGGNDLQTKKRIPKGAQFAPCIYTQIVWCLEGGWIAPLDYFRPIVLKSPISAVSFQLQKEPLAPRRLLQPHRVEDELGTLRSRQMGGEGKSSQRGAPSNHPHSGYSVSGSSGLHEEVRTLVQKQTTCISLTLKNTGRRRAPWMTLVRGEGCLPGCGQKVSKIDLFWLPDPWGAGGGVKAPGNLAMAKPLRSEGAGLPWSAGPGRGGPHFNIQRWL